LTLIDSSRIEVQLVQPNLNILSSRIEHLSIEEPRISIKQSNSPNRPNKDKDKYKEFEEDRLMTPQSQLHSPDYLNEPAQRNVLSDNQNVENKQDPTSESSSDDKVRYFEIGETSRLL
jgi:hypothetical protein